MKITKKQIFSLIFGVFFIFVQFSGILLMQHSAHAGSLWDTQQGLGKSGDGQGVIGKVGFSKTTTTSGNVPTITEIVGRLIKVVLTFLGTIFIVMILVAGFKWMTSQGAEKTIEDAKSQIQAALIGLVIVVASYGITYFVIQSAYNVTAN